MIFIVQHNLINQDSLDKIGAALKKHNIPHEFVGIIPFSREITSNSPLEGFDYLPYGSTTLTVETQLLGWRGLYFIPETFRAEVWNDNRDDMLNDCPVTTVQEATKFLRTQDPKSLWFTRPTEDLKTYSGQVIEAKECADWFDDAVNCASSGSYQLSPDTPIVLAEPRKISAEWRWFVVGGKVIDGSMYRRDDVLYKQHVDPVIDFRMYEEAQTYADKWLPHPCCVMDLALVDGELKVLEFNTINSSGFYDHDIDKIIVALWKYFSNEIMGS